MARDEELAANQAQIENLIFAHLCRAYVQRADARQKAMDLQYMEVETHDLAKQITKLITLLVDKITNEQVDDQIAPEAAGLFD